MKIEVTTTKTYEFNPHHALHMVHGDSIVLAVFGDKRTADEYVQFRAGLNSLKPSDYQVSPVSSIKP